tara:strand:+ start:345 stop:749 length:405 start_codon:yes stop_codon:yes gene_type:complete
MKKKYLKILKICLIALILYPSNSFADFEWKQIGRNVDGSVFYVDLLSIKKVGKTVYFFSMSDYVKPTTAGDLSARVYQEVNCIDLSFRYLKDFYYAQPMGNGEPTTIIDEIDKWNEVKRGSIAESMYKFTCNYK